MKQWNKNSEFEARKFLNNSVIYTMYLDSWEKKNYWKTFLFYALSYCKTKDKLSIIEHQHMYLLCMYVRNCSYACMYIVYVCKHCNGIIFQKNKQTDKQTWRFFVLFAASSFFANLAFLVSLLGSKLRSRRRNFVHEEWLWHGIA